MNKQAPEKRVRGDGNSLDVHSIFYTIQGEGPFTGVPAVFVRLAGCNLQCPGCDTIYTDGRRQMTVVEILQAIEKEVLAGGRFDKAGRLLVVISGGEPFRQNIFTLVSVLAEQAGFFVQIETNGTIGFDEGWGHLFTKHRRPRPDLKDGAYIVVSPKTGTVHPTIWRYACCVKYVMSHEDVAEDDGLPTQALGHTAHPRLARPPERWRRPIYLQPMDHTLVMGNAHDAIIPNQASIRACVRSCMKFGYTLQLQTHKIVGVE